MRSRPAQVHNPRTEAQVAHRTAFKGEVQLAARMRWAVMQGLTASARELGMTAYNLFVSLNQPAFSLEAGQLVVDWSRLQLSVGPVAPVQGGEVSVHEGNVLSVSFEKNPLHAPASAYDSVRLYAYSPSTGLGYLTAPVYRRSQRIEALLPDEMAGSEVHLYLMVQDEAGRCSTTSYTGSITLTDNELSVDANSQHIDAELSGVEPNNQSTNQPPVAGASPMPHPEPPAQDHRREPIT